MLFIGFVAWSYQTIQPPPPKICGSLNGPTITAPRIKLRDGRNLAYKEHGVPKDVAKHKIIFVHGFDACRHDAYVAKTLSPVKKCLISIAFTTFSAIYFWNLYYLNLWWILQDVAEVLGVYIVSFDRPGYGESDPHPNQTVKSLALDIEELTDKLGLGSKFYIIGFSLGGQVVWRCLKYIPHRYGVFRLNVSLLAKKRTFILWYVNVCIFLLGYVF